MNGTGLEDLAPVMGQAESEESEDVLDIFDELKLNPNFDFTEEEAGFC